MIYPDYKYVDTACGHVAKRNNLQLAAEIKLTSDTDCYRTYYRYPEQFKKHFDTPNSKGEHSVGGYSGWAYADYIPIDIDSKGGGLQGSLTTARTFMARIGHTFEFDIKTLPCFFSGSKGFHIFIPAKVVGMVPAANISRIVKKFIELLLTPWSIDFDPCIYDLTRLFRIQNTINSKSGLYKIPVTAEEILGKTIEEIAVMAKTQRHGIKAEPAKFNQGLAAIYKDASHKISDKTKIDGAVVDDPRPAPKNSKLCYHHLLLGAGEGERDQATYRLACFYKQQGMPEDMIASALLSWDSRNTPPLGDRIVVDKVKSAFAEHAKDDFGCNDHILKAHCQRGCFLLGRSEALDTSIVKTIPEMQSLYEVYTENLTKRLCKINITKIGEAMRGISPGEVMIVLAPSGVGKTALLINLQAWIGMGIDTYQLFFSMEQPLEQVYERMAQMSMGWGGKDVESAFLGKGDRRKLEELHRRTLNNFKKILLVGKDCLTVDEMIAIYHLAEQKVNQKIGVVMIDYTGRMKAPGKDSYETVSYNAKALKHMAKELDVAVIAAGQVSRKGGDGSEPVTLDSARDSGQIGEAADYVLGIWRPDLKANADKEEDTIRAQLLKNRKGPNYVKHDLNFTKNIMQIEDPELKFWNIPEPDEEQIEHWMDKY